MPSFTYCGGREHKGNEFLFLFLNFDAVLSASTARATHQLLNNCILSTIHTTQLLLTLRDRPFCF